MRITQVMILVSVLAGCGAASDKTPSCASGLAPADEAAVRAVTEAYRTAWLRGDRDGVLGVFSPDAVLLPAHGAMWVTGRAAITDYWWPTSAAPTTITKLDISIVGLDGNCRSAWTYGHDDVGWTTVESGVAKTYEHSGTYLNVFTKQADGAWKLSRHMWDDGSR